MRQDVCNQTEPPLRATGYDRHLSACHFADQLIDTGADEIFDAVGADSEALARFADADAPSADREDSV